MSGKLDWKFVAAMLAGFGLYAAAESPYVAGDRIIGNALVIPLFVLLGAGLSHWFYRIQDARKMVVAMAGALIVITVSAAAWHKVEAEHARKRIEAIRAQLRGG